MANTAPNEIKTLLGEFDHSVAAINTIVNSKRIKFDDIRVNDVRTAVIGTGVHFDPTQ